MYMGVDRCQISAFSFGSIISFHSFVQNTVDRTLVLDIEGPQRIHVKRLWLTYLLRERGRYDRNNVIVGEDNVNHVEAVSSLIAGNRSDW